MPEEQRPFSGEMLSQRLTVAGALEDDRLRELGAGERVGHGLGTAPHPRGVLACPRIIPGRGAEERPNRPRAGQVHAVLAPHEDARTSRHRRLGVLEGGGEQATAERDGRALEVGDTPHGAPPHGPLHAMEQALGFLESAAADQIERTVDERHRHLRTPEVEPEDHQRRADPEGDDGCWKR